jgi:Pyridoxamine 5'-phosphate oxidase
MSAYGVPEDTAALVDWEAVEAKLAAAHNYWIATGGPHASPVWGLWRDETFVFSCSPRSRKAREIERDAGVVVHLESGADVVIVEGVAQRIEPDADLTAAYSEKYGPTEPDVGSWYVVRPGRAFAWEEASFPNDVTRFDFTS